MTKKTFISKFQRVVLYLLLASAFYGNAQITQKTAPKFRYTMGPTKGSLIPLDTSNPPTSLTCVVNGINIVTSGSVNGIPYFNPSPNSNGSCTPNAQYNGSNGNWTGYDSTGTVTYTFSQPIYSARISYSSVDSSFDNSSDYDIGQLSINAPGMVLSNPCGVNIVGTDQIHCAFSNGFGNATITVASSTPFTTITLTNIGGESGWVTGNPCRFILSTVSPIPVNCPKLGLNYLCYNATAPQTTTRSIFDNNHPESVGCGIPCMVNGVPCSASNVTIEPETPLPFGCTFNPNGTVTIPAGVYPFNTHNDYFYRLRSVANPAFVSPPYRVDFGIAPRITTNMWQNVYQQVGNNGDVILDDRYVSGSYNILSSLVINPNTNGVCNYIPALVGPATASNTVTIVDTTPSANSGPNTANSGKLYFMINSNGEVVYKAPFGINFYPPLNGKRYYYLTYRATINNTGSGAPFTYDGVFVFDFIYPNAKHSNTNNHSSIKVYPNPSSNGYFNLMFDQLLTDGILEVYDAMGILVTSKELRDTNEYLLDLETVPQGMYRVKVVTKEETLTTTLVKQ